MANQITDNRTSVNAADALTNWVGSGAALDTEIFIEGTGSISVNISNTLKPLLYNMTTTQNWSNNTFYIWVNCGVVGRLTTKATGGMRIRFAGPTDTNFFEVYVGGSDSWPTSIAGGWTMFVVSIETARATAITNGWTGGTPPATTAIQRIGIAAQTSAMTRNVANTWVDAIWRLPQNTPGIIVEGRNGGSTPWTFNNIATQLGAARGTFIAGPGGSWVINTPLQIGINDTTTHSFEDTNQLILWDNQEFITSTLYGIQALGNAGGTTNVKFGIKTGTGSDATGAQGVTIQAASTGQRFYVDMNDANLNTTGFYGCTLNHAGTLSFDSTALEVITTQYIDCSSASVSGSLQLRNSTIDADTADGVAFMSTNDLEDISNSAFEFSDGHAVEITAAGTYSYSGNRFIGYGANGTTDAAILNTSGGVVTINLTGGGTVSETTYRNVGGGSSTSVNATFALILTDVPTGVQVTIVNSATRTELQNSTSTGIDITYSHSGGETVDIMFMANDYDPNVSDIFDLTLPSADSTIKVSMLDDVNYENP